MNNFSLATGVTTAPITTPSYSSTLFEDATSSTDTPCCNLVPSFVGLNYWYDTSITYTHVTVITQYLDYGTSTGTSLTTVHQSDNEGSCCDEFTCCLSTQLPTSILDGEMGYGLTIYDNATTVNLWGYTAMAYPTPFILINQVDYQHGTISTIAPGTTTCDWSYYPWEEEILNLPNSAPFVFPTTSSWTLEQIGLVIPTSLIQALIDADPDVTVRHPDFRSCNVDYGSGAPTVHVHVTALTSYSETTMKMSGAGAESTHAPSEVSWNPVPNPMPTSNPLTTRSSPALIHSSAAGGQGQQPPGLASEQPAPPAMESVAPLQPSPSQNDQPQAQSGLPIAQPSDARITLAPAPSGGIILPGGQILPPGSQTVISGHTIAALSNAASSVVIIDGTSLWIPGVSPERVSTIAIGNTAIPISYVSGSSWGIILPGGTTLLQNSAVSYGGALLSLVPSGIAMDIVIGGTTSELALLTSGEASPTRNSSPPDIVILPSGMVIESQSITDVGINSAPTSLVRPATGNESSTTSPSTPTMNTNAVPTVLAQGLSSVNGAWPWSCVLILVSVCAGLLS